MEGGRLFQVRGRGEGTRRKEEVELTMVESLVTFLARGRGEGTGAKGAK